MFKASFMLLVTLVLNVQLYSSAPIPGEFVPSSEPEEVAGEEVHHPEESLQKKLIPVVGESVLSSAEKLTSEEQTVKQDIPTIAKDPEPVFIGDQITADIADVASQESAPQEPLAVAPRASSEEETAPVQPSFAEASPGETTVEVALTVAVESESPEQHDLEDQAPAAPILIILSEASEDDDSEENAEVEAVAVENTAEEAPPEGPLLVVPDENAEGEPAASQEPLPGAEEEKSVIFVPAEVETEEAGEMEPAAEEIEPEQSGPEEPDVILDPEEPDQHEPDPEEQQETVPIISSEAKQEEGVEEREEEAEAAVLVVVETNAEEPLPSATGDEESVVLFPLELETEQSDPVEPAAEETQESAPEDQLVIAPAEPAQAEPDLKEEEETEEEAAVPMLLEGNTEEDPATNKDLPPEEEEYVLFPVELETEDEGQEEPAAEETVQQESAPEDPVVNAPVEGEPDLEGQTEEESIPIVSPEAPQEEAPEEHAKVEAAVTVKSAEMPVPIIDEPATDKEPLHSTPEEEKSIVRVPAELDSEEEGQEETEPQESAAEEAVVVVLVEPINEEPAPDDPIHVFPLEDSEEDGPEDNTEEAAVQLDPLPHEPALEEDMAPEETEPDDSDPVDPIHVFPLEDSEEEGPEDNTEEAAVQLDPLPHEPALEEDTAPEETEPDDSDPVVLTIPVTETPSESETIKKVLDPVVGVTAAAAEILTEAPAATDAEVESVLAAVESGDGTRTKTHREDFKAAIILIKDKPVAHVSRGAVLGAAFFTLMSFIIIGFILITVSNKLR